MFKIPPVKTISASMIKKPSMTEEEFQRIGNQVANKLESIIPFASRSPEELAKIDELKELMLKSEGIKLKDESNIRLLSLLQRKAKSLEPATEEASAFSVMA